MNIIFIGAGHVAWHLSLLFNRHSYFISHIWSRNKENAEELVAKIKENNGINTETKACYSLNDLDFSQTNADLAILAVADNAFERVLSRLILPQNCILAHTSGAQPMQILKLEQQPYFKNRGVFYPLQTFSKAKEVDFSQIPFCIEAENQETEEKLITLASRFSTKVFQVSSKDRSILHVAAVFACNFANHLWTISEQILKEKNLPFAMLQPLLEETLQKALEINPSKSQTGPASRKDKKVMEKHLQMIEEMNLNSNFGKIYKLISESIESTISQD